MNEYNHYIGKLIRLKLYHDNQSMYGWISAHKKFIVELDKNDILLCISCDDDNSLTFIKNGILAHGFAENFILVNNHE